MQKGLVRRRNTAMKKLIALALLLTVSVTAAACHSTDEASATTTPTATTQSPAPDYRPEVWDGETPAVGTEIADLLAKGNDLQSAIDQDSIALTNMTPYGEVEGVDKLFNGTLKGDKLGGNIDGTAEITWKTIQSTTVSAYILITGNDSADFGRLPYSWEFFGSNDDGATWISIDKVEKSGVTKANNAPFGYTVDSPASYTAYKLAISAVSEDGVTAGGSALQLNEMILVGSGASPAPEAPIVGSAAINALIASGNLTSHVVDPAANNISIWGDGAVVNAFDGNTTSTKMGGGGGGKDAVNINWITDAAVTVKSYVLYTGSDSGIRGRTPHAWVLFGSNDGENWDILDFVANAGIPNSNSTPYGYTVDAPASYTHYSLCILSVLNAAGEVETPGALQFNELVLIGEAAKK